MTNELFILWDPRDGIAPRWSDDGKTCLSSGCTGPLGINNAYLSIYPVFPEGKDRQDLLTLPVGGCIKGVKYSLSGSRGTYDIYRIQ